MNEQQLDQAINRLPRELTPATELWAQIEPRLTERQSAEKSPLWLWATAAMVTMVGVISWQLAWLPGGTSERQAQLPSAEIMLLQVYEQQKSRQLEQAVGVAEGFDNWQQQMQVWDNAIKQVRHALSFYPDEPQLLAQLQQLYQQQLSFIQKATLQQPLQLS